jgi:hypothetical protein
MPRLLYVTPLLRFLLPVQLFDVVTRHLVPNPTASARAHASYVVTRQSTIVD